MCYDEAVRQRKTTVKPLITQAHVRKLKGGYRGQLSVAEPIQHTPYILNSGMCATHHYAVIHSVFVPFHLHTAEEEKTMLVVEN